jgi:predicted Fe-Mo cluster-binding NifX family protein
VEVCKNTTKVRIKKNVAKNGSKWFISGLVGKINATLFQRKAILAIITFEKVASLTTEEKRFIYQEPHKRVIFARLMRDHGWKYKICTQITPKMLYFFRGHPKSLVRICQKPPATNLWKLSILSYLLILDLFLFNDLLSASLM